MRVLHVVHDFLPRHRAGTELYVLGLCQALQKRHEVQVLCAEYDPARPHGSMGRRRWGGLEVHEVVNNWAFRSFSESWSSPALHRRFEQVLEELKPELLHVHNLQNLSLKLPSLAKRRGIPSVATLHDYTLVCPSGGQRVHQAEDHLCATLDATRCARCFRQSPYHAQLAAHAAGPALSMAVRAGRLARRLAPVATRALEGVLRRLPAGGICPADIESRLAAARALFGCIELFVAPSAALGAEYLELGLPEDRLEISDNGTAPLAHQGPVPRGGPLRIGFVGTLAWHKGAAVLLEACRRLPSDRYRLLLHGDLGTSPEYVGQLRRAAVGLSVELRGGFDEAQRARVYRELDVLVVSSLWPENSPLVIHEAFQAGVPVVGANLGGIIELLGGGKLGPLYEARSPAALAVVLGELLDHPERLRGLAAGLPQVKSLEEDARDWEARYLRVCSAAARQVSR